MTTTNRETSARTGEAEKVLLVMRGDRDRELLASWLDAEHEVTTVAPDDDWEPFDVCIVDAASYEEARASLVAHREAASPVYLPVLLLIPEDQRGADWIDQEVGETVDQILPVPIRKRYLRTRLESLLRTRQLSRELDRERERFRTFAQTASDAIVVMDADSRVVYANEAVERVFGHAPEAVEGESLPMLMPARFREKHNAGLQRYLETGERSLDWEMVRFPGLHADGHEVPLEVSFTDFEGVDGQLFAGIVRDITAREELERDLRAETELLERVFDTSPVGITVLDTEGNIVRANETAEAELGLERSEILSRTYDAPEWDIVDLNGEPIPAEDLPFSRVMRTGEPVADYRHGIRVDGETRWLSINAAPLTDEDGNVENVVNAIENITEQVERRRELRETAASFQDLYAVASTRDLSFDEKLDELLALGADRLGVDIGYLAHITESTQHIVAARGDHELLQPGESCPLDRAYCRKTVETEGRVAIEDAAAAGWEGDPAYETFGLECYIGAKVTVAGDLHGTLCFADTDPRESFSKAETALVDLMAQWVSYELERQARERELREQKERFERLISQVEEYAIFMLDPDGHVVSWNEGAERIEGYTEEEILGEHFSVFYPDEAVEDGAPDRTLARATTEDGFESEGWRVRKDGSRFWASTSLTPIRNEEGTLEGFAKVARDMTERRERERELERYETIVETITEAVWVLDEDKRLTFVNQRAGEMLGGEPDAAVGQPLSSFAELLGDAFDDYEQLVDELLAGERDTGSFDIDIRLPDGQVTVSIGLTPLEIDGERTGIVGVGRDITDRVERERRYEAIFNQTYQFTGLLEPDGTLVEANKTALAFGGIDREDVIGKKLWDAYWFQHGDAADRAREAVDRACNGEFFRDEIEVQGDDRTAIIDFSLKPVTDKRDEVVLMVPEGRDITELKERERELERYETIVEAAADPIYAVDKGGHYTLANEAFLQLFDMSREELYGTDSGEVLAPETYDEFDELVRDLLGSDEGQRTVEMPVTLDGEHRLFEINVALLTQDDEFRGSIGVARDITDLRERERRLTVLDRVLRHNLRNKLNIVLAHAETITAETDDAGLQEHAEGIGHAGEQLLELSEQARRFQDSIDPGRGDVATVDVADIAAHVVDMVRSDHPKADVAADLPGEAWARASGTLELALAELVENAVEHNDRERPTVRVAVTTEADEVVIRVADDGPGFGDMERRVLLRGSESPLEHMQGVGLWLVRWTVTGAGGDLDIEENDPRGSVVTVRLPRANPDEVPNEDDVQST